MRLCFPGKFALRREAFFIKAIMPDKKQTTRIHSRIEITDPATVKSIERLQKESGHKTKPQLEWIVREYFSIIQKMQNQKEAVQ